MTDTLEQIVKDPSALFNSWLEYENQANEHDRGGFYKKGGAESYRRIWVRWLKHLAGRNTSWLQADATDLLSFIQAGITHTRIPGTPSAITQRRYFSVLKRIYSFTVVKGWRPTNPAEGISEVDTPEKENPTGTVMNPRQWDACQRHLNSLKPTSIIAVRDLAILRLLFDHALAPREIREIQVGNVKLNKPAAMGMIQIMPARSEHQARFINMSSASTSAVGHWLEVRESLLAAHAQAKDGNDYVFISQKSPELTDLALLAICKRHITTACDAYSIEPPVRLGPQIIRNTRIALWLEEDHDILQLCSAVGIKNVHGLKHIAWALSDKARARINALT